jgi:hypothetical protein
MSQGTAQKYDPTFLDAVARVLADEGRYGNVLSAPESVNALTEKSRFICDPKAIWKSDPKVDPKVPERSESQRRTLVNSSTFPGLPKKPSATGGWGRKLPSGPIQNP